MDTLWEKLEAEMESAAEAGCAWWMSRLVPREDGEPDMMYRMRKNTYCDNNPGWESELRGELEALFGKIAGRIRRQWGARTYERMPSAGSKLRTVGLPRTFCAFSEELRDLIGRFNLEPENTGWPDDGVMTVNPFLVYVRYRNDDTSEVVYRKPFTLSGVEG